MHNNSVRSTASALASYNYGWLWSRRKKIQEKLKNMHLHIYFIFSTLFSSWLALFRLHWSHGTCPPYCKGTGGLAQAGLVLIGNQVLLGEGLIIWRGELQACHKPRELCVHLTCHKPEPQIRQWRPARTRVVPFLVHQYLHWGALPPPFPFLYPLSLGPLFRMKTTLTLVPFTCFFQTPNMQPTYSRPHHQAEWVGGEEVEIYLIDKYCKEFDCE